MKPDCLLISVNVKLFFEFFVMRETVYRRGIGDPISKPLLAISTCLFFSFPYKLAEILYTNWEDVYATFAML